MKTINDNGIERLDEAALGNLIVDVEGLRKSLSVAQVREVLSITLNALGCAYRDNPQAVIGTLLYHAPRAVTDLGPANGEPSED